jgi:hypothetical protein
MWGEEQETKQMFDYNVNIFVTAHIAKANRAP